MASCGGYTYLNDLDDHGLTGAGAGTAAVVRYPDRLDSSLLQYMREDERSRSQYDYLEVPLINNSADNGGGVGRSVEVEAALTLDDFAGVNDETESEHSECRSMFDVIGAETLVATQVSTPSTRSPSVSGTDFDTLPIAPMARQPIDEPPPALPSLWLHATSLTHPLLAHPYPHSGADAAAQVTFLTAAMTDGKQALTSTMRYFETLESRFGPAHGQRRLHQSGVARGEMGSQHVPGGGATLKNEGGTCSHVGPVMKQPLSHLAGPAVPSKPPLQPLTTPTTFSAYPSDSFGFGIDTVLHGNELGFGRQPSFKRISPAAQKDSKKWFFWRRCEEGDNHSTGAAATPAAALSEVTSAPGVSRTNPREAAAVADCNEEKFNAWLETLVPSGARASSPISSAKVTDGDAVGESLKREVDVLMKSLLGDYEVPSWATTAPGFSNAVPGGCSSQSCSSAGAYGRSEGNGVSRGTLEDVPLPYLEVFLGEGRILTSPHRSTAAHTGAGKSRTSLLNATASPRRMPPGVLWHHAGSSSVSDTPSATQKKCTEASLGGVASGNSGGTKAAVTSGSPPRFPPLVDTINGRRRVWNPAPVLGALMNADAGSCSLPTPAATTATTGVSTATSTARSPPRAGEGRQRPSASADTTASSSESSLTSGQRAVEQHRRPTPVQPLPAFRDNSANDHTPTSEKGLPSPTTFFSYLDEDLLAGGYMTDLPSRYSTSQRSHGTNTPHLKTGRYRISGEEDNKTAAATATPANGNLPPCEMVTAVLRGLDLSQTDSAVESAPQRLLPLPRKMDLSLQHPPSGDDVCAAATEPPSNIAAAPVTVHGQGVDGSSEKCTVSPNSLSAPPAPPRSTEHRSMLSEHATPATVVTQDRGDPLHVCKGTLSPTPLAGSLKQAHRCCSEESTAELPAPSGDASMLLGPPALRTEASAINSRRSSVGLNKAATPHRRRLSEYRNGDSAQPSSLSRTHASALSAVEEAQLESARQEEREREAQRANEERRQRIQAFMAKRKAEKQVEEQRCRQMRERDRLLALYRETQDRQQRAEAEMKLRYKDTVGSGLNAIKASKSAPRPSSSRLRPARHSQTNPSVALTASVVPTTALANGKDKTSLDVSEALSPARRRGNNGGSARTKIRAVVVLMRCDEDRDVPSEKPHELTGRQQRAHNYPLESTEQLPLPRKEPVVRIELNEGNNLLRVELPQEGVRFFPVDEFLRVEDVAEPCPGEGHPPRGDVPNAITTANARVWARRRLSSLTLTEMTRKFLAGVNTALLLASATKAHAASLMAIREVAEGVVSHLPADSELFMSIAAVANGQTADLLQGNGSQTVPSAFPSSAPLGPLLDGVAYVTVTGIGHLFKSLTDAYKRFDFADMHVERLLVISFVLRQIRDTDVILSSCLITDAGCDTETYTAIQSKSQSAPFALFHSALGGPTLTTSLIVVDAHDVTAARQLLDVQKRLRSITNRPCHIGSVRRFLELAQKELQSRLSKGEGESETETSTKGDLIKQNSGTTTSSFRSCRGSLLQHGQQRVPGTHAPLHQRLTEQLAAAKRILDDPTSYSPQIRQGRGEEVRCWTLPAAAVPSSAATVGPVAAPATSTRRDCRGSEEDWMKMTKVKCPPPAQSSSSNGLASPRPSLAAGSPVNRTRASAAAADEALTALSAPHSANSAILSSQTSEFAPLPNVPSTRRPSGAPTASVDHDTSEELPPSPVPASATAVLLPARKPINRFRISHRVLDSPSSEANINASTSVNTVYAHRGMLRSSGCGSLARETGFMNFDDLGEATLASVGSKATTIGSGIIMAHAATSTSLRKGDGWGARPSLTRSPGVTAAVVQREFPAPQRHSSFGEGDAQEQCRLAGGPHSSAFTQIVSSSTDRASREGERGSQGARGCIADGSAAHPPGPPVMDPDDVPTYPSVNTTTSFSGDDGGVPLDVDTVGQESEGALNVASTKVRTLVVVDPRCRETSNVTYDNTMVIATTEDDFEEYDVDEVLEVGPSQTEPVRSDLLKELCGTLLRGCNAAILSAESRPTGFAAKVLKSVVYSIFTAMDEEGTHRRGHLSASFVKVSGESVVDLLAASSEARKLVIAISPLFGSCVHGVTYANIADAASFNTTVDAVLERGLTYDNSRDYGFLFCSLLLKLRLEEEEDVLVCSLVATFAGEHGGLYTSVLDRSPLVPRALFHYALGGPSYTIALLGIGSEETRANQMLQAQRRLGEMSNRATHPCSVAKFVSGIRTDLTPNLIAKFEHSRDTEERAATKEMIERLAEMVKDADAVLRDFDHNQPKAYLHEDPQNPQRASLTATGPTTASAPDSSVTALGDINTEGIDISLFAEATFEEGREALAGSGPSDRRPLAPRTLPGGKVGEQEDEVGERIQSLVCYEQVLMGAGSVAVQGNSILCTSEGGTRFDSDEVIVCDKVHRSLSSKLMDELVRRFLAGQHSGLLTADSSSTAFTPLMLRRIASKILDAVLGRDRSVPDGNGPSSLSDSFGPQTIIGEVQVSIALIKDDVVADLLPIDADATYHRCEVEHSPLYGPHIVGVTSHLVSTPQDFDQLLRVAVDNADPALQSADPGIMVVTMRLTQRVTASAEDVLVSSLVCTAVFDAVHHYENVLAGDVKEPLNLFRNLLHGPCFTLALFGISDEEEDPGKLLRALQGITQVRNTSPKANSVSHHIRALHRGIVKLNERMARSNSDGEKEYISSRVKVAEQLLAEAEQLLRNPLSSLQPRAFVPLGAVPALRS